MGSLLCGKVETGPDKELYNESVLSNLANLSDKCIILAFITKMFQAPYIRL